MQFKKKKKGRKKESNTIEWLAVKQGSLLAGHRAKYFIYINSFYPQNTANEAIAIIIPFNR